MAIHCAQVGETHAPMPSQYLKLELTNFPILMIMRGMKSICFALLSLTFFICASFAVPPVINYAGQVAVNGEAFTGTGSFKFALVNDTGSTTYWSNDGNSTAGSEPTSSVSVSVSGGLYSILLGNTAIQGMSAIDPSVFQLHGDAKLRVWFTDGVNGFQQLSPDRPFVSVPYALSSGSAGIAPGYIQGPMLAPSLLADLNASISNGSITRSMLESSVLNDLNASLANGSVSTAKMDPNLVRYFIPEISSNPAAVSIIQGTGTTLAVQATGKFLSYQWQKNGANLTGETNASLILSNANASAADANYSVVISNDWGSITSPLAKVTVATALPTITVLGSATLFHEAATPYTDAGATAVDALEGDLTSSISITSADINVSSVSQQVVTYSVTDAGGNANTATRTVTVQDSTNPVITLTGDSNFTHNLNTAWVDPGYDANDTLDGNLTSSVSISGAVDVNTTGTYILTYSVLDTAGNQADINRTVNVAPMGPWTFTNAGAIGRLGPTQAQIDANYSGTTLDGLVTINETHQGIQEWTVLAAGTYTIEALGAKGGNSSAYSFVGGQGARMKGEFQVNANQVLKILVGQLGGDVSQYKGSGGGGGTFVVKSDNTPFIIAGGGSGGGGNSNPANGQSGLTDTSGGAGSQNQFPGGTSGSGGSAGGGSGGGGGFSGDGAISTTTNYNLQVTHGLSFLNGGVGGQADSYDGGRGAVGGFGGGAGGEWAQEGSTGAGGGYSGGGGTGNNGVSGGGGSYNSGTNQDNQAGANEGHGKVIITYIGN